MTALTNPIHAETATTPDTSEGKRLGLPSSAPVWFGNRKKLATRELVLRDSRGKVLSCDIIPSNALLKSLSNYFDREFGIVFFVLEEQRYNWLSACDSSAPIMFSESMFCPGFSIAAKSGRPLTLSEREAAAAIFWMHEAYEFSTPKQLAYSIPNIFQNFDKDNPDSRFAFPYEALDERKAIQLVAIVEHYLKCAADVTQRDDSFFVSVPCKSFAEGDDSLVKIAYAAKLLTYFDIYPADEECLLDGNAESVEAETVSERMSRHITQQARLESKLDTLLARLDASATTATKTPAATVKPSTRAVDIFADTPTKTHTDPRRGSKPTNNRK